MKYVFILTYSTLSFNMKGKGDSENCLYLMQPFSLTLSVKIQPGQQGVKSSLILIHLWHSFGNNVPVLGSWWKDIPTTLPQLWHRLAATLPNSTDSSRREVVTESIFLSQIWLICLHKSGGRTARAHSRTSPYDLLRK